MIFNDVKGSMDKQDPEESTDPKDPSKLGDRSKNFTAGGKIRKILMQLYCSCLHLWDDISEICTYKYISYQWNSFFNFAVDLVDDTARSGEAGDGGSGEGVEPAEEEGSMPNGMEIEETKESSQGEVTEAVIIDEQ